MRVQNSDIPYMRSRLDKVVLVAEDEASIAYVVASIVEDLGCRARIAENGRVALDIAHEEWPDLVVTDLMMPVLGGAGLIGELRRVAEQTGKPRIPVILISASGSTYTRAAGADACCAKPFTIDDLETAIWRLLR
jgi:CheY-like chemotaxis protein